MPTLRGRVNDLAGLLAPREAAALEARLARFEAETGHQIVVLSVPSTGGEPIADFAVRVFESWRLGQAGLDNGVLLVVSDVERRVWISTGYGLEGAIPDAVAAHIASEEMAPHFRAGRMAQGIEAGVAALESAARGERLPRPDAPRPVPRATPRAAPGSALEVALFSALLAAIFGSPLRRGPRRVAGALAGGGVAGALCFLLVGSLSSALLGFGLGVVLGFAGPGLGGGRLGLPRTVFGGGAFGGRGFGGLGGGFAGGGGRTGGGGAGGRW